MSNNSPMRSLSLGLFLVSAAACKGEPQIGVDASPGVDAVAPDAARQPDASTDIEPEPAPPILAYVTSNEVLETNALLLSHSASFSPGAAQELTEQLQFAWVSDIVSWAPNGSGVVFRARAADSESIELFLSRLTDEDVGEPQAISGNLAPTAEVEWVHFWSPDSRYVSYMADGHVEDELDLYRVQILDDTTTDPTLLSTHPEQIGLRTEPNTRSWSPDSLSLAWTDADTYVQSSDCNSIGETFPVSSYPIEGTRTVELAWSPDSTRLAVMGDVAGVSQLYAIDFENFPKPTQVINGELPEEAEIKHFRWSPNSDALLYIGEQETEGQREVYVARIDGGSFSAPLKVNGELPAHTPFGLPNSGGQCYQARWAKGGDAITYLADQKTDGVAELWYVDVSGDDPAEPVRLNAPLSVSNANVTAYLLSSDGSSLVYLADGIINDRYQLYYVDLSGATPAAPVQVSAVSAEFGRVDEEFFLSPDDTKLLYRADQDEFGKKNLYVVDLSGASPSEPVRVSKEAKAFTDIPDDFGWSAGSSHLAFRADYNEDGIYDLYMVDISAAPASWKPIKWNSELQDGESITALQWASQAPCTACEEACP